MSLDKAASLELVNCYEECLTFHNNINISLNFHGIKLFLLAKAEKMCTWHQRNLEGEKIQN